MDDSSNVTPGVYVTSGRGFERDTRYIPSRITRDGRDGYPVEAGRYRLIVSRACPWASRLVIVRRLLGLEDVLSMGIAAPTHDPSSWNFDLDPGGVDPVLGIHKLQEAYFKRIPGYTKGITVPAVVDVPTGEVVTNDFVPMSLDLSTEWTELHRDGAPDLYPEAWREEMDEVMLGIYRDVNNGVYRCGFARSQAAYDRAAGELFAALDRVEAILAARPYLCGERLTEADVRLFPTLIRFDAVYHTHFKCNRRLVAQMPATHRWLARVFALPGVAQTVNLDHIRHHYYASHRHLNPSGIVPAGPDVIGALRAMHMI